MFESFVVQLPELLRYLCYVMYQFDNILSLKKTKKHRFGLNWLQVQFLAIYSQTKDHTHSLNEDSQIKCTFLTKYYYQNVF